MLLHYQRFGSGHPLVILHGLYGSGDNWLTVGRSLAGLCEVILVDQRNHGSSPHSSVMTYASLAEDIAELMDHLDIRQASFLGHSMGGKAAMWFAMAHPGRIANLIVADIGPRSYRADTGPSNHRQEHLDILAALERLDPGTVGGIGEADQQLSQWLPSKRFRQFILKNLKKDAEGRYEWRINIPAIRLNLENLADGLETWMNEGRSCRQFPVLFIRGEKSPYIRQPDEVAIRTLFPQARIATLKNTGHWLHAEEPEHFTDRVKRFLIQ